MRRLTVLAGAFGAALLMSSGVFAQVPADPNNPNEAIPDAIGSAAIRRDDQHRERQESCCRCDRRSSKAELERDLCRGRRSITVILSISRSRITASSRSITISQHKARTAARYRRPTVVFERLLGKGALLRVPADSR